MSREKSTITNQGEIVGKIHKVDGKFLESGKAVATVTLAITESWQSNGATQSKDYFPAVGFYGKPAEAALEFNVGDVVRIVYSLRSSPKKDNAANEHWTNVSGFVIQLSSQNGVERQQPQEEKAPDMPF